MNQQRISIGNRSCRLAVFFIAVSLAACSNGGGGDGGPSDGGNTLSATSEGTLSSPITLTVGTPHAGGVGKLGTSYYQVTAPANGWYSHRFSLRKLQADLSWTLFSDPGYSQIVIVCDHNGGWGGDEVCAENISPGKTRYISVEGVDGQASTYTLLVEPVVKISTNEADGRWTLCKFDSAMGHDMVDEMVIVSTALTRTTYHANASTNGTCSGPRTVVETLTYTIGQGSERSIDYWTDGTALAAPPFSTSPPLNRQTVQATQIPATRSTGAQEKWMWWVQLDARVYPSKSHLHISSATPSTPCAPSSTSEGYPRCLISTEYYLKQ